MKEDTIKLGGGTIHASYVSDNKVVDHEEYITPNTFDVTFLFWAPWHEGSYTVFGGRNIGLTYIISLKNDGSVIERNLWKRETEGNNDISEELKNLYEDKLKQFAIDLAMECRERKLFEHVVCTKEQLQKA